MMHFPHHSCVFLPHCCWQHQVFPGLAQRELSAVPQPVQDSRSPPMEASWSWGSWSVSGMDSAELG